MTHTESSSLTRELFESLLHSELALLILLQCCSPCVNSLQSSAASELAAAAKDKGDYITLNSAFRSSAQQYLLYNWYLKGKQDCQGRQSLVT